MPIGRRISKLVARDPRRTQLTSGATTYDRLTFEREANRAARHLATLGTKPGSVVSIFVTMMITLSGLQRISRVVFRLDGPTSVWISYLLVAGIMIAGGALAMRMRQTKAAEAR